MKRVAYLTPLYVEDPSGVDRTECYPRTLAKAVAATGECEVEIVAYSDLQTVAVSALAVGVTVRLLPTAKSAARTEPFSWEILGALREADIVHVQVMFTRPSEVGVLVARVLDKPVCATDDGGGSSVLGKSLGMLEVIDRVICRSEFERSLLKTSTPISVVPGGVDDEFFAPPIESVARDRLVFSGRLLPRAGVDRLLEALPGEIPLTIFGPAAEGEYADRLHELSRGKQVEFVSAGSGADLRSLYQRAFAVVLPSVYVDCYGEAHSLPEPTGIALLEGMACGAPAVCSRVAGMPELVDHGGTGFIFDDPSELTRYVERLASDERLVDQMGSEARRRVEQNFGLSRTGTTLNSIYANLHTSAASG